MYNAVLLQSDSWHYKRTLPWI